MDSSGNPFGQADIRHRSGHADVSMAGIPSGVPPTGTATRQYASAGVRTNPIASAANYGGGLLAPSSSNIFGQFFVGPYNIGSAIKSGMTNQITMEVMIGAACNILVTGWIINSITSRPSVLDSFGLVSTTAAQVGFGLFFSPMPTTATKQMTPGPVAN